MGAFSLSPATTQSIQPSRLCRGTKTAVSAHQPPATQTKQRNHLCRDKRDDAHKRWRTSRFYFLPYSIALRDAFSANPKFTERNHYPTITDNLLVVDRYRAPRPIFAAVSAVQKRNFLIISIVKFGGAPRVFRVYRNDAPVSWRIRN